MSGSPDDLNDRATDGLHALIMALRTDNGQTTAARFWRCLISVPRPAMFAAMVSVPGLPASATIWLRAEICFAFKRCVWSSSATYGWAILRSQLMLYPLALESALCETSNTILIYHRIEFSRIVLKTSRFRLCGRLWLVGRNHYNIQLIDVPKFPGFSFAVPVMYRPACDMACGSNSAMLSYVCLRGVFLSFSFASMARCKPSGVASAFHHATRHVNNFYFAFNNDVFGIFQIVCMPSIDLLNEALRQLYNHEWVLLFLNLIAIAWWNYLSQFYSARCQLSGIRTSAVFAFAPSPVQYFIGQFNAVPFHWCRQRIRAHRPLGILLLSAILWFSARYLYARFTQEF